MDLSKLYKTLVVVIVVVVLGSIIYVALFNQNLVYAMNWDYDLKGTNWLLTGWHLENASDYISEFGNGLYHGYIKDLKGNTIYSVSFVQGYFPHGWGIPKPNGGYYDNYKPLKGEGYPHLLTVKFKIVDYQFNLNPQNTYCGFCWVTVGIDLRGSVKGKNYNAPIEMDGDSWVLCANLFQVVLDSEGIKYSKKGDVLLKCRELYHGEGVEICWHYSIAVLDSENIELGKWYEITISLEQLAIQMENELGFKINKTHLIQPFIETCGGEIEAYFDVVKLY